MNSLGLLLKILTPIFTKIPHPVILISYCVCINYLNRKVTHSFLYYMIHSSLTTICNPVYHIWTRQQIIFSYVGQPHHIIELCGISLYTTEPHFFKSDLYLCQVFIGLWPYNKLWSFIFYFVIFYTVILGPPLPFVAPLNCIPLIVFTFQLILLLTK